MFNELHKKERGGERGRKTQTKIGKISELNIPE